MMRLKSVRSFLFFCIVIGGCTSEQTPLPKGQVGPFKRYPYEKFHLRIEYLGDIRGYEDIYVAGYGRWEARNLDYLLFQAGQAQRRDEYTIMQGSDQYTGSRSVKVGRHFTQDYLDSLYRLPESVPSPNEVMNSLLSKARFDSVGTEEVFGRLTTKYLHRTGRITIWSTDGITFRRHALSSGGGPPQSQMVVQFDTNWVVDSSKFALPEGTKYEEVFIPGPIKF